MIRCVSDAAGVADGVACCTGSFSPSGLGDRGNAGGCTGCNRTGAFQTRCWFLEAICPHRTQPRIGHELPALFMLMIAVHEGVFFGLPVEALKVVCQVILAHGSVNTFHVVCDAGRDETVRHGIAGWVHVLLGEPHAPLAVHRGEVHLARCRSRQPHVAGLTDLRRNNVHIDGEQSASADGSNYCIDEGLAISVRNSRHRILHHIGSLLVGSLEVQRVERGLIVVAGPDVVDAALSFDEKLVDIRGRLAYVCVGRARIPFLMPAHPDAATARTSDISRGECNVHESAVRSVVVVTPDKALLVGEHRTASGTTLFRLGDPFCRFSDLVDRKPCDPCCVFERCLVCGDGFVEILG